MFKLLSAFIWAVSTTVTMQISVFCKLRNVILAIFRLWMQTLVILRTHPCHLCTNEVFSCSACSAMHYFLFQSSSPARVQNAFLLNSFYSTWIFLSQSLKTMPNLFLLLPEVIDIHDIDSITRAKSIHLQFFRYFLIFL